MISCLVNWQQTKADQTCLHFWLAFDLVIKIVFVFLFCCFFLRRNNTATLTKYKISEETGSASQNTAYTVILVDSILWLEGCVSLEKVYSPVFKYFGEILVLNFISIYLQSYYCNCLSFENLLIVEVSISTSQRIDWLTTLTAVKTHRKTILF